MSSEDERPETPFVFPMAMGLRNLYMVPPPNTNPETAPDQGPEPELGTITIFPHVTVPEHGSVSDSTWEDLPRVQPPASKAAIEALASVEIEEGECAICLGEWKAGGLAKEMPCKHRFHGNCIDKWLGIHGSCPICRYRMPLDEAEHRNWVRDHEDEDDDDDDDDGEGDGDGDGDEQGREGTPERFIQVNFSIHGVRRPANY